MDPSLPGWAARPGSSPRPLPERAGPLLRLSHFYEVLGKGCSPAQGCHGSAQEKSLSGSTGGTQVLTASGLAGMEGSGTLDSGTDILALIPLTQKSVLACGMTPILGTQTQKRVGSGWVY